MGHAVCDNVLVIFISNKSLTFPFENDKNIYRFTVSPDGVLMITVDEGNMLIYEMSKVFVFIIRGSILVN